MPNNKFNSLREGQGFRHNGKRYRRRGTRAICLDGGDDLLSDFLMNLIILDIITDGELDGNFAVEADNYSEPVQDNSYSSGSSYDSDSGGSSYDSGGGGSDD